MVLRWCGWHVSYVSYVVIWGHVWALKWGGGMRWHGVSCWLGMPYLCDLGIRDTLGMALRGHLWVLRHWVILGCVNWRWGKCVSCCERKKNLGVTHGYGMCVTCWICEDVLCMTNYWYLMWVYFHVGYMWHDKKKVTLYELWSNVWDKTWCHMCLVKGVTHGNDLVIVTQNMAWRHDIVR